MDDFFLTKGEHVHTRASTEIFCTYVQKSKENVQSPRLVQKFFVHRCKNSWGNVQPLHFWKMFSHHHNPQLCMSRVIFVYLSRSAAFIFNIAANKSTLTIGFGNALQSTRPRSSAAFNFATVDVAHSGCVL